MTKKKHRSPKRMNKSQLSKIVDLYYSGMIPYQIAKHLAIPNGVVLYHLSKLKALKQPKREPQLSDFLDIPIVKACAQNSYIQTIRELKEKNQRLIDIVAESLIH